MNECTGGGGCTAGPEGSSAAFSVTLFGGHIHPDLQSVQEKPPRKLWTLMCIDPTLKPVCSSLAMGTDGFFLFFLSSLFTFLIFGDRMSLGSSDWPGNSACSPA